jgi:molybdopterin biosynthesis enzyme
MSHGCTCAEVDLASSPRESTYPMREVAEALAEVARELAAACARAPIRTRTLPLHEARGYLLGATLHSTAAFPPFPASTMDGYAVRSEDGRFEAIVTGEATAGRASMPLQTHPLQRGEAIYITTGAPVPEGADAVVPVEWTEAVDAAGPPRVRILQGVDPGTNIRPIGSDVALGEVMMRAGQVIGPAEIGLLAGAGHDTVNVREKPNVGSAMETCGERRGTHQH